MADKKISALPAATTPLAGTEVLPIVQGGVTDKVSVANLTVGRDVSAKTLTGESNGVGAPSEVIARNTAGGERIHLISRNSAGISFAQSQNSQLHIGSYDNFAVQILVNNTSKMLFDTNSDVKVQTGNLVVGTAGKGIDFSANGGDVLSQYDEGTWTPVVTGSTTAGTANYDFRIARYTRIGRMVQFEVAMQWNSGTGTGNLRIDGLPFTNAANYTSVAIGRIEDVALSALHVATAFVDANANYINIWQYPIGGGTSLAVPYDAAGVLFIAGSYSV